MNRRRFLALLAGGAGVVVAAPVRRIWAVGATLESPRLWANVVGVDYGFQDSTVVVHQGPYHHEDFLREFRGYPGRPDDLAGVLPKVVHLDHRFAKTGYLVIDDVIGRV